MTRPAVTPLLDAPGASAEVTEFLPIAADVEQFLPAERLGTFDHLPPFPHPLRHPLKAVSWLIELLFGLVSLVVFLAVIAAIPLVNFLALGYLLEAEGRVARSGKLRHAFPLLPLAPRLGTIVLGCWLWSLPLRFMATAAADAQLIEPGGRAASGWNVALRIASVLIAAHLCLALARGGGFWCFFRPFKNIRWLRARPRDGDYWTRAGQHVREFIAALRLPHHFWLGVRGFVGALVWLFLPTALYAALQDTSKGGQILLTLVGGFWLILTLMWVPFLQARLAAEDRLRSGFHWRTVVRMYFRAPWAWFFAVVLLYALSLPLYLFKIVSPPRDALWGITLIFIATIYPAKVLVGWAYHRATKRTRRVWIGWSLLCGVLTFALLAAYVFLLFFTPAIGEHGRRVLFEHHALLLPVPF